MKAPPTLRTGDPSYFVVASTSGRLFIERGADVNAIGKAGYTPLLFAASIDFGDTEMMELLLEAGARVDIRNPAGKTALDLAREYQHTRFVRMLERRTER